MQHIFVTGADGFIGSHLTQLLLSEGYRVKALSQYNSFNNWGWLEDIQFDKNLEIVTGDIRDLSYCKSITHDVDAIFHLAALIAIPYSYVAPESYVDTNIKGTLNICQAARENEIDRVIHTSTSEVYGSAKFVPITEEHPLQPQSPYSASKIAADSMAMSFYNAFELPVTIARPFNTYGPRQSARAVIPTIITQIINKNETIELGDLSPTRDFNYVLDTCRGLLDIYKSSETIGEVVNIGTGSEISIGDLVETIKRLMKSDIEIIKDDKRLRPENSEVQRLLCDNSKLKRITGYKPKYSLENGLLETINWFANPVNINKYKSNIYNV